MKNKHIFAILFFTFFLFAGCTNQRGTGEVYVKYRETPVDITTSAFEELNTSKSSWIEGAWYDAENEYMVINLNGTNYHYCDLPEYAWEEFKDADSFGSYYNANIKGEFDCRSGTIPNY